MNHITLYRKYRPTTFDEIYGQSVTVQTLRNQIKSNRISHAYLFCGLKGSGKTSLARIFAKAVNCEYTVDGNPCNTCDKCNSSSDIIEIDAASNNGVENIRQLIDESNYKPLNCKYKVYIIDEVHMLSNSAFNSLLKTLEEPPEHVIFILATTELYKVPDTIKSRCQIYTFKRLTKDEIVSRLKDIISKENESLDENNLNYIASKADGSLRDAITILEQVLCYKQINGNSKVIQEVADIKQLFGETKEDVLKNMIDSIDNFKIKDCINIVHEQYYNGISLKSILNDLYKFYFDKCTDEFNTTNGTIYERYIRILGEGITNIDRSSMPLMYIDVLLIKLCKPEMEKDYNSVVQRMSILEKELESLKNGITVNTNNSNSIKEQVDENVILYYNNSYRHEVVIGGITNGRN